MSAEQICALVKDGEEWYFSGYQFANILSDIDDCVEMEMDLIRTTSLLILGYKLQHVEMASYEDEDDDYYLELIFLMIAPDDVSHTETTTVRISYKDLDYIVSLAIERKIYPYNYRKQPFDPEAYGLKPDFPVEEMIGPDPPVA